MRSIRNADRAYQALALAADDLLEFHAARLLLLTRWCGTDLEIDGLTKLAKLDFLARYPAFLARACAAVGESPPPHSGIVEAAMVRHHYGPWDPRYYHVLAFLEGAGLLTVTPDNRGNYRFRLTDNGADYADRLSADGAFTEMVEQMRHIASAFGRYSGSALKRLIYEQFDAEVGQLPLGRVIA